MAQLQRTRILAQQRIDLPDYNNIEDFICADFKAIQRNVWTKENYVISGFAASGNGTTELNIALEGSSCVFGEDDGTFFVGANGLTDLTTSSLTPSSTNFVEISISQDTGGADSRAFWDQTAAGGEGGEFSQIIDTFIFLKADLEINTSNFTGDADKLPICEVDVNGAGVITAIRDRRNLFFRLGKGSDVDFRYSWSSRTEPPETQFSGADKDLDRMKVFFDALMSRIAEIAGTTYWYEDSGVSLIGGFRNSALSAISGIGSNTKWTWDGSNLTLTDDSGTPADADQLAAIRLFDSTANLLLTRMDGQGGSTSIALADGEVLWVELPDPLADVDYDDIGLTSTNFRISARGSVPNDDTTFWLAYREGNNAYLRYLGELEPGETAEISDNINQNILNIIGVPDETSDPNYSSTNVVTQNTDLVSAIGELDAAAGASSSANAQDRSSKVIEGGTWSLAGNGEDLTLSQDAYVQMPGLTNVRNTISAQTINLPNANSVAYVEVNRTAGAADVLTVNIADVDSVAPTDNTVVIARRVSDGVLVGQHSFLLKPGEYLELDGALAEINRRLNQLQLQDHETDADKARIGDSDSSLLDGKTLSQILGDFLLEFPGAVIDFTTGQVFEDDGTTPLGNDFTPFSIPVGEYYWYGISLLPGTTTADNRILATVQVDLADSANAVQASAPRPVISGDVKLGAIQVQNNGGSIEVVDIVRLGVGSGTGSGLGGGSPLDFYEDRLNFGTFNLVSATAFRESQDDFVDPSATGAYSPADRAFKFSAIGETLIDLNNATDEDFLISELDVNEVEFYLRWQEGAVDESATYEVSRNGGNEWQTVTMERVGSTNAYRGFHVFDEEAAKLNLDAQLTPDATRTLTDTGSDQALAVPFTPASVRVFQEVDVELNKLGTPTGTYKVKLVKDDSGAPSTDVLDIVSESDQLNVADLSAGDNTVTVNMPDKVLLSGQTYWLVIETDAAYKSSFSAASDELRIRVDSSSPVADGASFDGTTWSATVGEAWAFQAKGREIDLRVRVTSGTADTLIDSYGIYYEQTPGISTAQGKLEIDEFVFSGDDNKTTFALTNISNPHPDLIEIWDITRGQVYFVRPEVCRIDGSSIVFVDDFFNDPGETIRIVIRQLQAGVIDNSDTNAANIASNESRITTLETPTKYQVKTLSSNISSTTADIADLRFNNLEIGKIYRLSFEAVMVYAAANVRLLARENGNAIGRVQAQPDGSGPEDRFAAGTSVIFEATGTQVTFDFDINGTTGILEGNGTISETKAILEELPFHEVTTDWT